MPNAFSADLRVDAVVGDLPGTRNQLQREHEASFFQEIEALRRLQHGMSEKLATDTKELKSLSVGMRATIQEIRQDIKHLLHSRGAVVDCDEDCPVLPARDSDSLYLGKAWTLKQSLLSHQSVGLDEPLPLPDADFSEAMYLINGARITSSQSPWLTESMVSMSLDSAPPTSSRPTLSFQTRRDVIMTMAHRPTQKIDHAPSVGNISSAKPWILMPDSRRKCIWDVCTFFILLHDFLIVPYTLAWAPSETVVAIVTNRFCMLFWFLDMVLNFNTAVFIDGEIEARRPAIARRYLKRSFLLDIIAIGNDLVGFILWLTHSDQDTDLVQIVKAQRAARLLKLGRLYSIWPRLVLMMDMLNSSLLVLMMQFFMVLLGVGLVNHLICCTWWKIGGSMPSDTGAHWTDSLDLTHVGTGAQTPGENLRIKDRSLIYQYITSYHWAVEQLLMGATDVKAVTSYERMFSVGCNIVGTFFSAILTSWFAALLVQHQQQRSEFNNAMKSVRRYLGERKVNQRLANRIQRQLTRRLTQSRRSTEADVPAFSLLPKRLKMEMRYETLSRSLHAFPFFYLVEQISKSVIQNVCLQMSMHSLGLGDELFQANVPSEAAYVLVHGETVYVQRSEGDEEGKPSEVSTRCRVGTLISEPSMWTDWVTRGALEATSASELVSMTVALLEKILSQSARVRRLLKAYGTAYLDLLKEIPSEELNDIDRAVDHSMVIITMDPSARMEAAEPVLRQLEMMQRPRWLTLITAIDSLIHHEIKTPAELAEEVKRGECGLIFDSEGNPARVAFVLCVRAERSDGMILVQAGKVTKGHPVPKLQLPSTKMMDGESPNDAARRVLETKLQRFGSAKDLGHWEHGERTVMAKAYGLVTRYLSTTAHVSFNEAEEEPPALALSMMSHFTARNLSGGNLFSSTPSMNKKSPRASTAKMVEHLPHHFYYIETAKDAGLLYAWMAPSSYDAINEPGNEKLVSNWVSSMIVRARCSSRVSSAGAPFGRNGTHEDIGQ